MSGHHYPSNWTFRNVQVMEVDEATHANQRATTTAPHQSTAPVHPPSMPFQFNPSAGATAAAGAPPSGQQVVPASVPAQQSLIPAQAQQSFFYGSATGTGFQANPPTTLASTFLSQSEGYVAGQHKQTGFQSSSLQSFSSGSKRVMIPDNNGFPHYYGCDDPSVLQFLRNVAQTGFVPVHSAVHPSMGSLPSTSSVYSSQSSFRSQAASTGSFGAPQTRNHANTLRRLYQMLDAARSQSDIDEIKSKIQETIHEMEIDSAWAKHTATGVSHSKESPGNIQHTTSEGNLSVGERAGFVDHAEQCETSRVLSQGHLFRHISKPKLGLFKKFNLAISRFFSAKL